MTTPPSYSLTAHQTAANRLLGGPATHILLRGGSRSGKTFILTRALITRAIAVPETRHAVFRFRLSHMKGSIWGDTFPKVLKLCFPGLPAKINKSDFVITFPNKSEIVFGGLDDKDRTEKILGQEYATVYLNECSQIPYDARNKVVTRLAQKSRLRLKAYYDANPPSVASWLYRMFEAKVEPKSGAKLLDPERYATMMLNPDGNRDNLAPDYIRELEALPEKERRRFLLGEYLSQVEGALWSLDGLDQHRIAAEPDGADHAEIRDQMRRIVVAIDPSGCKGPEDKRSDEVGITVTAVDHNDNGYLLQDLSGRYSPEIWARVAVQAYDYWSADRIIAETNFGGALVTSNIRAHRENVPVSVVTASRGKVQRAEPVAALYEKGKVWHLGAFPDLEDQYCNFSTAGYMGPSSPDRADSAIWGLTELMLPNRPQFAFGAL